MRSALFFAAMIVGEAITKAAGKFEPMDQDLVPFAAGILLAFIIADIVELFK